MVYVYVIVYWDKDGFIVLVLFDEYCFVVFFEWKIVDKVFIIFKE